MGLVQQITRPTIRPVVKEELARPDIDLDPTFGLTQGDMKAVIADGDPVGRWTDRYGSVAFSVSGSNRPIYKPGVLNGYPVIRSDGVASYMDAATVLEFGRHTMIFVWRPTSTITLADGGFALLSRSTAANPRGFLTAGNFTGGIADEVLSYVVFDGATSLGVYNTANLSGWSIHSFGLDAKTELLRLNGSSLAQGLYSGGHMDSAGTRFTNVDRLFAGAGAPPTTNFLAADIARILIWRRALRMDELVRWERYLGRLYNLPVA